LPGLRAKAQLAPARPQRHYAAAYQTLVFLAAFAGPLLGAAIAAAYGIKTVFVLSGTGRLAATALFIALVRERPAHEPATPAPQTPAATVQVAAGR
jgi:hypothetical protein